MNQVRGACTPQDGRGAAGLSLMHLLGFKQTLPFLLQTPNSFLPKCFERHYMEAALQTCFLLPTLVPWETPSHFNALRSQLQELTGACRPTQAHCPVAVISRESTTFLQSGPPQDF